jgi:[ribosomal protein S5]-alanine N-acetyltransferase
VASTFLSSMGHQFDGLKIDGDRVWMRPPRANDYDAWLQVRSDSRAFLEPWEPTWPSDVLTRASFKRRLKRYARDVRDDYGYSFFVFRREDDELVGGVNLSHVHRGVSQSCSMGYWMGQRYARQGLMSDAVKAAVSFSFDDLRLHRIEAACVPDNIPSRDLLRKVGFQEEGYARNYLRINGKWQDHLLFAWLSTDTRPEDQT